jgi:malonate transporter and related proteins
VSDLLVISGIVLPVFGLIFCGYILSRLDLLPVSASEAFNTLVYFVAFPALLFVVIARTPPALLLSGGFLGAWTASVAILYVITMAVSALLYGDGMGPMGMRSMNATCSSTAFIGIPLCVAAFGEGAALPAVLATTVLAIVDISATVLLLELDGKEGKPAGVILRKIVIGLIKNPLMIAVILGGIVTLSGLTLPAAFARFCDLAGACAVPLSLLTLGLFIAKNPISRNLGEIGVLSILKLVAHPVIAYFLILSLFPLDRTWKSVTILLAALPPASTCFVIAQRYNTHMQQTSSLLVISTMLAVISSSVVLFLFRI